MKSLSNLIEVKRRAYGFMWRRVLSPIVRRLCPLFYDVEMGTNAVMVGLPRFEGRNIILGRDATLISSPSWNPLGVVRPCTFGTIESGVIVIGDRFSASGCCVWSQSQVSIGDDVMLGANVTIVDTDFHAFRPSVLDPGGAMAMTRSIHIGNGVQIGMNVVVLKGVRIGEFAVVGANCVITKDVPPGKTVVSARNRLL